MLDDAFLVRSCRVVSCGVSVDRLSSIEIYAVVVSLKNNHTKTLLGSIPPWSSLSMMSGPFFAVDMAL